jgi:sorting nexin-25
MLKYIGWFKGIMWPGGQVMREIITRKESEKAKSRTEASLMLATLVPDVAGNVVGRANAQAASRRIFATLNNPRMKYGSLTLFFLLDAMSLMIISAHLMFSILDEVVEVLFTETLNH